MLKSKRIADNYENVYLSNLKILSTTRHTSVTDITLHAIDAVLQDIESQKVVPPPPEVVCATVEEQPQQPLAECDHAEDEPLSTPPPPPIPILMAIQYHDIDHLTGAVEGFLRDYRDVDGKTIESTQTCKHCLSTEVQHSEHIAEISHWRKTLMHKLNLPTSAYV